MRFMTATLPRATDPRVTFAELQHWPDDGLRYELYDGEVIIVPSPFARHQRVVSQINEILPAYERSHGGIVMFAPLDIVFDEHNVVQPDVVYFREQRRHVVKDWEATRAGPDLAVEVVSRKTEAHDRGRKMQMFARFLVPEYWIVDPAKNILEIYVLGGGEYDVAAAADDNQDVASPTLPDLSLSTSRIFTE
jgi:Uma2 family endonuclease